MSATGRISVIGLGNVLLGDDAIGPLVIAHLRARFEPNERVEVLDLGTPGLNLHPYLHGRSGLVFVDAVRSKRPEGSVILLDREALMRRPPPPRVSPHDLGLKESLRLAELEAGRPIPAFLVGVAIEEAVQGAPMRPAVEAAVEPALEALGVTLARMGAPITPRTVAEAVNVWWAASVGDIGAGAER